MTNVIIIVFTIQPMYGESKYCFSSVHVVAGEQGSSFNCIVNEPIGSELIAQV